MPVESCHWSCVSKGACTPGSRKEAGPLQGSALGHCWNTVQLGQHVLPSSADSTAARGGMTHPPLPGDGSRAGDRNEIRPLVRG